jgi:hypothetical protein
MLEYTQYFLVGWARRSTGRSGQVGGPSAQKTLIVTERTNIFMNHTARGTLFKVL